MGINLFRNNDKLKTSLLDTNRKEVFNSLTALQNEISVSFETKVIAITSISNDSLCAAFAESFSNAYNLNQSSVLIIDANLYNPSLRSIYDKTLTESTDTESDCSTLSEGCLLKINEKKATMFLNEQTYPSVAFKNGIIHKIINDRRDEFDHIIMLMPSINKHKDISIFKDIVDSVILVVEKNRTKREDVFDAVNYCKTLKIPLAKVVIVG